MSRHLGARLTRLEQQISTGVDLAGEAQRFGSMVWSSLGFRCYSRQADQGARLTLVGAGRALTYDLPGLDVGDLR